jgi:hypothetical protein
MKHAVGYVLLALWVCCATTALYADCGASQSFGSPARILNFEAPVRINTAGSGIVISDIKLNIDPQKISGETFSIRNDSSKPLVAYMVGVDFYFDTAPNKPIHAGLSEDSWFLNGAPLEPGRQEACQLAVSVIPHQTVRLQRVAVNLQYAEFSDGSVVGVNARTLKAKFDKNRREKLEVQNHYASMLNSGISPANVAKQIEMDLKMGKYQGPQRTALVLIASELTKLGPENLAKKLLEAPSIPLSSANP